VIAVLTKAVDLPVSHPIAVNPYNMRHGAIIFVWLSMRS
jgi:hypothetical protein